MVISNRHLFTEKMRQWLFFHVARETMAKHLTSEQFYLNGMFLGPLLEKILPAIFFAVLDSYY